LTFIRDLIAYREVNETVADKAPEKMVRYLWYLSGELVSLAFDDEVPVEEKRLMVQSLTVSSLYFF